MNVNTETNEHQGDERRFRDYINRARADLNEEIDAMEKRIGEPSFKASVANVVTNLGIGVSGGAATITGLQALSGTKTSLIPAVTKSKVVALGTDWTGLAIGAGIAAVGLGATIYAATKAGNFVERKVRERAQAKRDAQDAEYAAKYC